MKTTISTIAVVLATSLFSQAEPEEGKGKRPGPPAEMIAKFDKDGDGKLSAEERKALMEGRKAEMLKKFDKDGDGKLSAEERKAMPPRAERSGGRQGKPGRKGKAGKPGKGKGPKGGPKGK